MKQLLPNKTLLKEIWEDQGEPLLSSVIPAYLTGGAARIFWRMSRETQNDLDELKDQLDETFNMEEK